MHDEPVRLSSITNPLEFRITNPLEFRAPTLHKLYNVFFNQMQVVSMCCLFYYMKVFVTRVLSVNTHRAYFITTSLHTQCKYLSYLQGLY